MSITRRSDILRFDELQRTLRLALDLRDLPHGSEAQRRQALDGLCALLGASVGIWASVNGMRSGPAVLGEALDRGWSGARERAVFHRFCRTTQWTAQDPSMPPFAHQARGRLCTVTRAELLDDRAWYRSEHVQELRRAADVDSFIYASCATSDDTAVCISLHRPWRDRPFDERERRLVDVFYRECAFLYRPPPAVSPALLGGLRPRLRDTLTGLARGLSEKQLAAELGISLHTLHGYVKELHRHFGVQSRGELLARCLSPTA
jgi:DNA-binding CsgD family transcriptional regulator